MSDTPSKSSPMTPEELETIGRALFGAYGWQTKLAHALEKDPRYIRRYKAGDVRIPTDTADRIRRLRDERLGVESFDYRQVLLAIARDPEHWRIRERHGALVIEQLDDSGSVRLTYKEKAGRMQPKT